MRIEAKVRTGQRVLAAGDFVQDHVSVTEQNRVLLASTNVLIGA